MRYILFASVFALAVSQSPAGSQEAPLKSESLQPTASEGGEARFIAPRPVDPADDPVNARAAEDGVDGLIVTLTVDGASVTLDGARPARIPKTAVRANLNIEGDAVRVSAFAGGDAVSDVVVPDPVLYASEGGGLVRMTRRQVVVAIPADRAIDRIEVEAGATLARSSLDVSGAYADYCKDNPRGNWCPTKR
jgi:hypothetical protein